MLYDTRNRKTLDTLAPNTKVKAYAFYQYCLDRKIEILIYEGLRTLETQKKYVAEGKSQTMRSWHLVGQAIDFVPVVNGKTVWDLKVYKSEPYISAINYAKSIGFKWGGDWTSFIDAPHLEYPYNGYGTDKVLEVKEEEKKMDPKLADDLLDLLGKMWHVVQSKEDKDRLHKLAEEVRRVKK